MKRLSAMAIASISALTPVLMLTSLTSCYYYDDVTGSGVLVSRELGYRDFEGIGIAIDGVVTVVPDVDFGITLTADDNVIDLVTVYPDDGGQMLRFGMERWRYYNQVSISIEIRMPSISKIEIGVRYDSYGERGSDVSIASGFPSVEQLLIRNIEGVLAMEALDANTVDIHSSESTITGAITCTDLVIDDYDSSIDLSGSASAVEIDASSGDIDLSDLIAGTVEVRMYDAVVSLYVTDSISGLVDETSELTYSGDGSVDTSNLVVETPKE